MASLYELTQNAAYLQELLESGEIDDQTFADSMESMMVEDKIENICKMIRNLEARAAACKAEKDSLAKKEQTAKNGVQRLKESLLTYMQTTKNKKVAAGLFSVTLSNSKKVEIFNEEAVPFTYYTPQPPKLDKNAITADIKAGQTIPGAALVESPYVTIK